MCARMWSQLQCMLKGWYGLGRQIRGMPSKLSEAELSKYRSTIYGLSAHVGHVPKMHLGRNKWHMAAGFSESAPATIPLSPEAVETAQRAYSAGRHPVTLA